MNRMIKNRYIGWYLIILTAVILGSGCVYYNTFFMARKKFNEAEKSQMQNAENRGGQRAQKGGRNLPGGRRGGGKDRRSQGGQSTSKVTPQEKLLYEDAIKKASKVLKFHPDSKWIDDALWLIGKSYYNMGDYFLADRKFKELVINHPESKFADDAFFYRGLCQIELGNNELALEAFAEIENGFRKSDYFDDVYFVRGKMAKDAENYQDAIDHFTLYLEKYPKGDSVARATFCIGECKEQLGDHYGAYQSFSSVRKRKPSRQLYFDAALASASAALKTDSISTGMKILVDLAKDERYFAHSARIRLRIAEGYYLQGNIEKAIEEYTAVTNQNPRSEESAEAYYRLGLIYQNDLFDIDNAKESFSKAQTESPTSVYKNLALGRSAQIAKLETYQIQLQRADSLRMAEQGQEPIEIPDSLGILGNPPVEIFTVPLDSLGLSVAPDIEDTTITITESDGTEIFTVPNQDSLEVVDSLETIDQARQSVEIQDSMTTSGEVPVEIYTVPLDSLGLSVAPDIEDTTITITESDGTEIFTVPDQDSLEVVDSLKTIDQARQSVEIQDSLTTSEEVPVEIYTVPLDSLGLSVAPGIEEMDSLANFESQAGAVPDEDSIKAAQAARADSIRQDIIKSGIETRFLLAELYAYELNRPDSALHEYLLLVDEHPNSAFAPKALLASAYIEFNRDDTTRGNEHLRRIIDEYPRCPQAALAAEMLGFPLDLSDNAIGIYAAAESLIYYGGNPDSAIVLFRLIAETFPDLAPKAAFAAAWVLDQVIGVTDSSAYFAYASVNEKYPTSAYASAAKYRMGLETRPGQRRNVRREREEEPKDLEEPQLDPDSLRRLAHTLPQAPPEIKKGEFLYPRRLLQRDLKGQVLFKIKIDITGAVEHYEIIGPSGEYAIDSAATAALLETEFDTSNLDFAQLESYFRYSIPFERPDINIFNDPYLDRGDQP